MDTPGYPGNMTDHGAGNHSNDSGHGDQHGGHGIHVASWNFEHVRQPFIISIFLIIVAVCKLGKYQTFIYAHPLYELAQLSIA